MIESLHIPLLLIRRVSIAGRASSAYAKDVLWYASKTNPYFSIDFYSSPEDLELLCFTNVSGRAENNPFFAREPECRTRIALDPWVNSLGQKVTSSIQVSSPHSYPLGYSTFYAESKNAPASNLATSNFFVGLRDSSYAPFFFVPVRPIEQSRKFLNPEVQILVQEWSGWAATDPLIKKTLSSF
jgi:hypothetical protein